jgi:hypothetical protein
MNLSETFAQNHGRPVHVDGRLVHPIYKRAVRPDDELRLTMVSAREPPLQGIRIKLETGQIHISGHEPLGDVVLWTNTAPKSVVFRCQCKKPSELRLWNCWQDEQNVMQAWTGNAGIVIEESAKGMVRLMCNSRHALTFEDLVLELETMN